MSMGRNPQGPRPRGSQHWLQVLVNSRPGLFEAKLSQAMSSPSVRSVRWLSPLQSDDYSEYQDEDFLALLGIHLTRRPLHSFWPRRGPVWDGLALSDSGSPLIVEAKANIPELESPRSQASSRSANLIRASLNEAKPSFGARATSDWMGIYYQYTNRLAHLHLLRKENGIPAYLVFLYFVGATDVEGPSTISEWQEAIRRAHAALGLGTGPLSPYVVDLFLDVGSIAAG